MPIKQLSFFNKFTNINYFHWTSVSILTIIVFLHGCGGHVYHVVEPGETLYSVSWMYGHDYKTVAKWNRIKAPYILHKGQRLRVAPNHSGRAVATTSVRESVTGSGGHSKEAIKGADKPNKITLRTPRKSTDYNSNRRHSMKWQWPVKQGKLIQTFTVNNPGRRGIDVAGKDGQTIYSASDGSVVYSGNGLPLYGKLIIVKHNEMFLSAYAHNKKLLVKEGEDVKAGQPIARMGNTGANTTKLHFEIRHNGKPVDPMQFLPPRTPDL